MRTEVLGLWLLLLAVTHCYGGVDIAAYPHMKKLNLKSQGQAGLSRFDLDEEVFSGTDNGFTNIRLLEESGAEVPFLVRPMVVMTNVMSEVELGYEILTLDKKSETNLAVIVARKGDESRQADVLSIQTGLKNFEKQVAVYGSNDRETWDCLASDQPVYDYSRHLDLRNERVLFKKGSYRFYKVEINNISESSESPLAWFVKEQRKEGRVTQVEERNIRQKDFRIDRLRFCERVEGLREQKNISTHYGARALSILQEKGGAVTFVTFETRRVPVASIKLLTESSNFSRAVVVEGGRDGKEWQALGKGVISKIGFPGRSFESLDLHLAGIQRWGMYRLRIENHDSPPLVVAGIVLSGDAYEGLFFDSAGKSYALFYGALKGQAPSYDMATVLAGARTDEAKTYVLDTGTANESFKKGPRVDISGKAFLVIAILGAVAVLFWLIFIREKA